MKQAQTKHKTIGLCLSGGGARGLAHVGVLKALLEYNIKPTHISGTSMGAIIGVLYASGYDISQMLEISHHLGWKQILPDWTDFWKEKKKTFLSTKYLHKVLKQIPQHNLEQLNMPVWVSTTSIDQGHNILYHEGEIIPIVSGSSAIPGLFDPVPYDNHLLIDGGVSNNFPLRPLMDCDLKIGVDVNYYDTPTHKVGTRDVLSRAMTISINQASSHYRQHCDIFIYPPKLQQYNILDFDKADAIIAIGYEETCTQLSSFLI